MSRKNIFFELHSNLPREGPGNNASTQKAYEMLNGLPAHPRILDVGCGPGMQTIELAKLSGGTIAAVDTHAPFLAEVQKRAVEAGMQERIRPLQASMFSLPFPEGAFDVIWSEGAIYIMGFEAGLKAWRPFLKTNGYVVVSEVTWLRENPPREIQEFWAANYPEMKTTEQNLELVRQSGYTPVGHFLLPESGWWDYYLPMEKRISTLRGVYGNEPDALRQLDEAQREIDLYRMYSSTYGYVFYVMQKH